MKDRTGKRYGLLTVIKPIECIQGIGWSWECVCDCGAHIIVWGKDLTSGSVKSCGCLRSGGELKITQLLTENNIPFIKQKTFSDCYREKACGKMHYDFFVNGKFLLEYDGEQHFKAIKFFGGEEGFLENKRRDEFKNNYAKEHNIPLKRIPYWDLNNLTIEDIMGDKYLVT